MLETVDARVRAGVGPTEGAVDLAEVSGELELRTGVETLGGVEPWLPQRSWVTATPAATSAATSAATPAVTVGRQTGRPTATLGGIDAAPGRHRRPSPPPPRLLTLPASLRSARVQAPRAATIGLILVVVLTAVGFGVRVAWAKAASAPRPVTVGATGSAIATGGPHGLLKSSPTNAGAMATSVGAGLTVHVVGQVFKPGLVRLPAGSRVADALAKAGGPRPDADLAAINLARMLADGEQLRVPLPGEVLVGPPPSAAPGSTSGSPGAGAAQSGGLVRLNSATVSELDALPGVGPVLAQRIIDWRTEHGRFASVDELGEVSGIGEKVFAQLKPKVTL